MNALIVYGSNYNVAVYCSINYVPKSKKSELNKIATRWPAEAVA